LRAVKITGGIHTGAARQHDGAAVSFPHPPATSSVAERKTFAFRFAPLNKVSFEKRASLHFMALFPVPKLGLLLGTYNAPLAIDVYIDPCCPYSKKMFKCIYKELYPNLSQSEQG
jgi:hypothetical protein